MTDRDDLATVRAVMRDAIESHRVNENISNVPADVMTDLMRQANDLLDRIRLACTHPRTAFSCASCNLDFCMVCDAPMRDAAQVKTIASRYCDGCVEADAAAHGLPLSRVLEMRERARTARLAGRPLDPSRSTAESLRTFGTMAFSRPYMRDLIKLSRSHPGRIDGETWFALVPEVYRDAVNPIVDEVFAGVRGRIVTDDLVLQFVDTLCDWIWNMVRPARAEDA